MRKISSLIFAALAAVMWACSPRVDVSETVDSTPAIFPDYTGVTVPVNIVPLNFMMPGSEAMSALFNGGGETFEVSSSSGKVVIPEKKWSAMLEKSAGGAVEVTVRAKKDGKWVEYRPFEIYVAQEPMDSHIAYRLIEPGYELWSQMGIYQRDLTNYKQTAIFENRMSEEGCVNCHSFCNQEPEAMLFHMRAKFPGTMLVKDGVIEKLNTKTDETMSALVYPSWHPSGRFVAFSVNATSQTYHPMNRVEVYDSNSDVVVYDVETHEIIPCPAAFLPERFETFPTFSPDGRTLYFCSAEARRAPEESDRLHYDLFSVSFDPENRTFGTEVDTLVNALRDSTSVSFPRVSPDGNFLVYTLAANATFPIWHKEADLWIVDMRSGEHRPMDEVNSPDNSDSYHSWSSNSRWLVFSSRRLDGLYTRPFFTYIGEDGRAGKPFLLPQKDPEFYDLMRKSYNIPEFVKGEVKVSAYDLARKARNDKGTDVTFSGK